MAAIQTESQESMLASQCHKIQLTILNSCFLENPVQRTDETHGIAWNIYTQSIYYSSHLLQTTDKSALQTLPKGMSLFSFKVLGQSPSFAKDGNEQFKCTYYSGLSNKRTAPIKRTD